MEIVGIEVIQGVDFNNICQRQDHWRWLLFSRYLLERYTIIHKL